MPLAMTRPTPHPKTGVFRLRKVIPPPLREAAERLYGVKSEFIVSLGTKSEAEARRTAPAEMAEIERKLEVCRHNTGAPPQRLTHLQCVAMAGAWRRERLKLNEAEPGSYEGWEAERDRLLESVEHEPNEDIPDYEPSPRDISEAESIAAEHGIVADRESLSSLAQSLWLAQVQYAETMMRRSRGDYGPDDYAARYPTADTVALHSAASQVVTGPADGAAATFEALVRGYCRERGIDPDAKPVIEGYDRRSRFACRLAEFLGHDDAAAVTAQDAVRWKERIIENGKSLRTVGNRLSALSAVWTWGVKNHKVTVNPFAGLATAPKKAKGPRQTDKRPFTPSEAATILQAARGEAKPTLRWLPWVLALTGARLAEIVQGRKEDVIETDGFRFIRVHEEGGKGELRSVKNGPSVRNIPVHPALRSEGFLAYVAGLPDGSPLFPDSKPDGRYANRARTATRKMSRWVRSSLQIADKNISPCHSWRHWFVDAARDCIENMELRNAITGHADTMNESNRYGLGYRAKPERLHEAMSRIAPPVGALGRAEAQ